MKVSRLQGVKYVPIQPVVTIPRKDDNGLLPPATVQRENFNEGHMKQILEFWDHLEKTDSSFNAEKAFLSTFKPEFEGKDVEARTAPTKGAESSTGGAPAVPLDEMTVEELKNLAKIQGIDLDGATKKADIVERIAEATEQE